VWQKSDHTPLIFIPPTHYCWTLPYARPFWNDYAPPFCPFLNDYAPPFWNEQKNIFNTFMKMGYIKILKSPRSLIEPSPFVDLVGWELHNHFKHKVLQQSCCRIPPLVILWHEVRYQVRYINFGTWLYT